MGRIFFTIGAASLTVKYVIGGEMHQFRVRIPARDRQIANGQRVHLERGQRLSLGYIYLVVSGGIENHGRIHGGDSAFDRRGVRDIDGGAVEAGDFVPASCEFRLQLHAELTSAAKHGRSLLQRVARFIAN